MGERLTWKRIDDYAMRCEPWTICAIGNGKGYSFELWHEKRPDALGSFSSPAQAKERAVELESKGMV